MYNITDKDIGYCDALCYRFHGYWGRIPDEDQIQDAREGMCIAAQKYNPELSPRFMTYARWWIKGMVNKYYNRTYRGYPRSGDVYYQNLQVGGEGNDMLSERRVDIEYEKKEIISKLVESMPKHVEIVLKRSAEGETKAEISRELGYKDRQGLDNKVRAWRKTPRAIYWSREGSR